MRVQWLEANQAWCVVFGEGTLVDIDGKRFWSRKLDLEAALNARGLGLSPANARDVVNLKAPPKRSAWSGTLAEFRALDLDAIEPAQEGGAR